MKNSFLCFFLLLFVLPSISFGAEVRTLEIDFSFNAPADSTQQLLGYRLFKDGVQVCQTNEPNSSTMDCSLPTEDGTFTFTLAAYYSNDTKGLKSKPSSFTIDPSDAFPPVIPPTGDQGGITFGAEPQNLQVDFAFDNLNISGKQLLGYKLYKDGVQVCQTAEPNTSRMDCALNSQEGTLSFTLTAYYDNGSENTPSSSFPFTISSTHSIDFNWNYTDSAKNAGGFRIFDNGILLTEITSASARQLTYSGQFTTPTHGFTIAAVDANGVETSMQNSFKYSEISTPIAVLSSSTATGTAPLAVTFDGSASFTPNTPMVSYSWLFGDGTQATGKAISHVFTAAGTYGVVLTVKDNDGLTDKVTTPIIVSSPVVANEKPSAIVSTDISQGGVPLTVTFDGSQSSDSDGSIASYNWDFGDGSTGSGATVQHSYASTGFFLASLQVTDNKGATDTAISEINCDSALPTIEVGEVAISQNWTRVLFNHRFNQPVVIAGPPTTMNEKDPVLVRVRNIDQDGFEVRLQEWNYQDGSHIQETLSYMVMEKGVVTLSNGAKIEAGYFTGSNRFKTITLQQFYKIAPIILTQVTTETDPDAVTGRLWNITQGSFQYVLQEQQSTKTSHSPETVGYIAWEPGQGDLAGLHYEAGATASSVTHNWFNLNFQNEFPDMPFFVATMQTYNNGDTAALRAQGMSPAGVEIKFQEEQSKDTEVSHPAEAVSYLAISSAVK